MTEATTTASPPPATQQSEPRMGSVSRMRLAGMVLFPFGLLCTLVLSSAGDEGDWIFGVSLMSLGAMMWMLGAIEWRLIQIRDAMNQKQDQG